MKEDNSIKNFDYPGENIEIVVSNPDEYIVPECLDACKSFWNKNIFTASCSNRYEKKDKDGNITKYIMFNNLSNENIKRFNELVKSNPNNYRAVIRYGMPYYVILISSTDTLQDRDLDSKRLLDLTYPFEMQDCLDGFDSIKKYYIENLTLSYYPSKDDAISISDSELMNTVKKYLEAIGKLDLLDIDRKVVYKSKFYRDAHQRYLDYLRNQPPTNPDPHEL